jgi:hypothetical protein
MAYTRYSLLRQSLRLLKWHKLLPTTRWGDRQYARILCLYQNGYWPRKAGGDLTDFTALLKGSPEIETPLRKLLTDKDAVKYVIGDRLGVEHSIPTHVVLQSPQEIDKYPFGERCVVKPTHSSGQVLFLEAGQLPDHRLLKGWLQYDHYLKGRERNYRGLKPKILVEDWIDLTEGWQFKAHCIRGKPIDIQMFRGQGPDTRIEVMFYLDTEGVIMDITGPQAQEAHRLYPIGTVSPLLPANYPEILSIASIMARDLLYARVDMFWTQEGIWINEITSSNINGAVSNYGLRFERDRGRRLFGPRGFCLEDFPELR